MSTFDNCLCRIVFAHSLGFINAMEPVVIGLVALGTALVVLWGQHVQVSRTVDAHTGFLHSVINRMLDGDKWKKP